jgi:hypothetical protein
MRRRNPQQRLAQIQRRLQEIQRELPLPHPIHRHVDVVAAARGVQTAGDGVSRGLHEQTVDVEEQVFVRAVVANVADAILVDRVERRPNRAGVRLRHNPALGQHHEVGVMNRKERADEKSFRIFEIVSEYGPHVLRRKFHPGEYIAKFYSFELFTPSRAGWPDTSVPAYSCWSVLPLYSISLWMPMSEV